MWQKIWITPRAAVMDQMLVAGCWSLDFKRKLSLFIQAQVSSIQYLANCGINDRFHDVVIFGPGLSGLGFIAHQTLYDQCHKILRRDQGIKSFIKPCLQE